MTELDDDALPLPHGTDVITRVERTVAGETIAPGSVGRVVGSRGPSLDEFHHDVVLRVHRPHGLPGAVLVVATNCNGGVKEVLAFEHIPDRYALWHTRCPDNPEFEGELAPVLAEVRTLHWFDPCALLAPDARSEMKPECRRRQRGGGYEPLA